MPCAVGPLEPSRARAVCVETNGIGAATADATRPVRRFFKKTRDYMVISCGPTTMAIVDRTIYATSDFASARAAG